jgi:hypothetical protein
MLKSSMLVLLQADGSSESKALVVKRDAVGFD